MQRRTPPNLDSRIDTAGAPVEGPPAEAAIGHYIDSVKDYAIFTLDRSGRVASWNLGAERIKGYKAEEIIGRPFSVFYLPQDIERGRPEELLRLAAEQGRIEVEELRVRKDGSRFSADVVLTAVR